MINSRSRRARHAALVLGVTALLAASCGSDDDTTAGTTAGTTGAPAPGTSEASSGATTVAGTAPTAASTSGPAGAAAGDAYAIGMSLELTGPLSELGEGFLEGAEAYIDSVNAEGGAAGHPIELVVNDHADKPDQAVANVTRMVTDDGVVAVTGFVHGSLCKAAERVTTDRQVPLLCSSAEPDLLDPVRPFLYSAKMPPSFHPAAVVTFLDTLEEQGTDVAYFGLDVGSSAVYGDRIVAGVNEKGWNVVADERVPINVTDMSVPVANLAASEPDIVITGLTDATFVLFMRTLQSQGIDVPVINYESGSSLSALEGVGSGNVYVERHLAYPEAAEGPGVERYMADVQDAGVDPNGPFVINGYVAAMLIVGGLQECGDTCTAATLQRSLDALELDTGGLTAGPFSYSADDHAPGSAVNIYRWNPSTGEPELVAEGLAGSDS